MWDFRLPRVVSINVSGHKYGLVYPGVGWVVWRDAEHLPQELVFNINYLGADQSSFTLNFSKGASQVIGQYYQLIRLGKKGYTQIMRNLTLTADYLSDSLKALGFIIMSQGSGEGLPLVAFRLPPDSEGERSYDEFALAHQLRVRSWVVPAYTMAPKTENLKMLRVVVREDFTRSRCESLIKDVKLCMQLLEKMDKDAVKRQQDFINKHHLHSGKATHNHPKFKVRFEKHCYDYRLLALSCHPSPSLKQHMEILVSMIFSGRRVACVNPHCLVGDHLVYRNPTVTSLAFQRTTAFSTTSQEHHFPRNSTNDMGSLCQAEAETELTYFRRMRSTLCRARRGRPMRCVRCGQSLCRAPPIEGPPSLETQIAFFKVSISCAISCADHIVGGHHYRRIRIHGEL